MEINQFYEKVSELKTSNPVWFGLDADPVGTDAEIEEVERRLSITLPEEYKKFIKIFGGGYFAFTIIFSVYAESEWNIINQNQSIGLINSHHFLAISDNQAGDYYGFKVVDGVCESKVYVYDHESRQIEITKYQNLFEYLMEVGLKNPT